MGFSVLIAGVSGENEHEGTTLGQTAEVLRLDPAGALRRLPRGSHRGRPSDVEQLRTEQAPDAPATARPRSRPRRLVVTATYYLLGVRLVMRTRPQIVHANDYNTMWIGIAARLLCGSRLVYDSHELWPDRNGRPEWRPWLLACEALFVRAADATITTSPGYAATIARRYRVPAPVVVRNIPSRPEGSASAPVRLGHPLGIYVGGLMPGRGLEQAMNALAAVSDLRLRLIGPGAESYRRSLVRCAERFGVDDRVELRPAVPASQVVDAVAEADFGLLLIQPVCRSYELTLPNKLFEYAAAGVPVLASALPVIGPLVTRAGIGKVVAPTDVDAIAQGMATLCDPDVGAALRARVKGFAARETWERERSALEAVYGARPHAASPPGSPGSPTARHTRKWAAENPGNRAIREELMDVVFTTTGSELQAARQILDVGCGTGWWLERLAADARVTAGLHGVDIRSERVAAARARVPSAQVSAADARELPYPDDRFDVVSLFTVLSSLATREDVEKVLTDVKRVLAPGGVVLIWEPRILNPMNRRTRMISLPTLRRCLGDSLEVRSTTVVPWLARRLRSRTEAVYPRLAAIPVFRTHRLVRAKPAGGQLLR